MAHDALKGGFAFCHLLDACFLLFDALLLCGDLFRGKRRNMTETMNRTGLLSADLSDGASAFTKGDDCLMGVFAALRLSVFILVAVDAVVCVASHHRWVSRADSITFATCSTTSARMRRKQSSPRESLPPKLDPLAA